MQMSKEKALPKERSIPKGFSIKWSTQTTSNILLTILVGYITYYCTNALSMSPGLVGIILLLSKLLDGVTDIIASIIIERTNTKMGKARPFILLAPIGWVVTVMMFSTPALGTVGNAIYIFVTYFMINSVCATLFNAAEPVYLARALKNKEDSAAVLSVSGLIASLCALVAGVAFPFLITAFGSQPGGWTKIALIYAFPGAILSLIRFFTIKERTEENVQMQSNAKFGVKDIFKVMIGNKHALALIIVAVLSAINANSGPTNAYFFQYIMGNLNLASVAGFFSIVGMFCLLLVPALMKRFTPKQIITYSMLFGILGSLLKAFPNMVAQIAAVLVLGLAAVTSLLLPSLFIDCMDYNEWKTGRRVESVFGAMNALATKVGSGLASILIGFVMGIGGYNGDLAVQSQSAQISIIVLYAGVPVITHTAMFFLMKSYNIDKEMPKVRAELEERKKSIACGGSLEKAE